MEHILFVLRVHVYTVQYTKLFIFVHIQCQYLDQQLSVRWVKVRNTKCWAYCQMVYSPEYQMLG